MIEQNECGHNYAFGVTLRQMVERLKDPALVACDYCGHTLNEGEILSHLNEHAKLEAENEELRELFVYFFGENYEELAGGDAEKQFAQSLSKRTTPLSDEEKRNALTGESDG